MTRTWPAIALGSLMQKAQAPMRRSEAEPSSHSAPPSTAELRENVESVMVRCMLAAFCRDQIAPPLPPTALPMNRQSSMRSVPMDPHSFMLIAPPEPFVEFPVKTQVSRESSPELPIRIAPPLLRATLFVKSHPTKEALPVSLPAIPIATAPPRPLQFATFAEKLQFKNARFDATPKIHTPPPWSSGP